MKDNAGNPQSMRQGVTMLTGSQASVSLAVFLGISCSGSVFADKWSTVGKILRGARHFGDEDYPDVADSLSWDGIGLLVVAAIFAWSSWILLKDACHRFGEWCIRSERFSSWAKRIESVISGLLCCTAACAGGAGIAYVAAPFMADRRLENRILIGGAGCGLAVYLIISSLISRYVRKCR